MRLGLYGARARARILTTATGLILSSHPVHADGPRFDLAWSAPPGCPSGQAIEDATRARLAARGYELPDLFVEGSVAEERGGFVVALQMKDRAGKLIGERTVRVDGQRCSEVAEPTALVLAMIIAARPDAPPEALPNGPAPIAQDPVSDGAPPTDKPAAGIARESPSSSRERAPRTLDMARASVPPSRLVLGAAGVASVGVLPAVGAGLALRATYAPRSVVVFGLELGLERGGSVRANGGEVGFDFAGGGALLGIEAMRTKRFDLLALVGARAGIVRTSPVGFALDESAVRPTAFAGAGLLVRMSIAPRLFVETLPQAEVALLREGFHIRHADTLYAIHRMAFVSGRLSLGIAYEFR